MATEVDNRVVQMNFDNKKFEKGCSETLSTLDKLKNALKFDKADDGFNKIQEAADSVSLSKIQTTLDGIAGNFTAVGIIGIKIWENITDAAWNFVTGGLAKVSSAINSVENQIKTGGWNRALNLEKAEFMINNLDQTKYAWDETADHFVEGMTTVKKSVNDAVSGTAYSLDEAAVSAASFLAAGVDGGEEMYNTLRSVMGIASTYSQDFGSIARIFQNVAARGFLMYGDMSDLQMHGVAATDTLTDYLGISADELDEAYKDHLIDFETFRDAFLDRFGNSLDKANATYTGALSNLKSALSRIGAEVATPLLDNLIPVLNSLRVLTNNVKSALVDAGIFDMINESLAGILKKVSEIADSEKTVKSITNIIKSFGNVASGISQTISAIGTAFKSVFLSKESDATITFSEKLYEVTKKFADFISAKHGKIFFAMKNFFELLKPVTDLIKQLLSYVPKLLPYVVKVFSVIASAAGKVISFTASIIGLIAKSIDFNKVIQVTKSLIEIGKNVIEAGWLIVKDIFSAFIKKLDEINEKTHIFDGIRTIFETVFDAIHYAVSKVIDKFAEFTGTDLSIPSAEEIKESLVGFFDGVKEKAEEAREKLVYAITHPVDTLETVKETVGEALDVIKEKTSGLLDIASEKFESFSDWISSFKDNMTTAKDSVVDFADESNVNLDESEKSFSIFDSLKTGLEKVIGALDAIKEFAISVGGGIVDILKHVFSALAEYASDMTVEDFLDILKTVVTFFLVTDFNQVSQNISSFIFDLKKPLASLNYRAKNTIAIIGDMALELGIAVMLIVLALTKLTQLDTDKVTTAIEQIAAIIGIFVGALALMKKALGASSSMTEKMDKVREDNFIYSMTKEENMLNADNITEFGKVMVEMAAAIYIIAKAMEQLKDLDVDKLGPIMAAFAAGLAELIAAIFGAGKLLKGISAEFIKNMAVAMVEISVAVLIISKAIRNLGELDQDQFEQGLLGMTAIVALFAGFITAVNLTGKMKADQSSVSFASLGASFVLLATAVTMMLPAILVLGNLDPKKYKQALKGLTTIIGAVAVLAVKGSAKVSSTKLLALGFSMVEMALAVNALLPAVIILSAMEPEKLVQGIGALVVMLGMLTIFAGVVGDTSKMSGVLTVVAMALAVNILGNVIEQIAKIDDGGVIKAVAAIAIIVAVMVAAAFAVKKVKLRTAMTTLATSMLIISVALMAFTVALKGIASLSIGKIVKGIVTIVAVLAVMLGAAAIIKYLGLNATIAELSVSILALGAAMFVFGVGMLALCSAMFLFGTAASVMVQGILIFIYSMDDLFEALSETFADIASMIYDFAYNFTKLILIAIEGALEGIEEEISEIVDALVDIILDVIDAITLRMADIVKSCFDFIVALISETGLYLQEHKDEVVDAFENLVAGILEVGLELVTRFKDFGEDLCWGILEGMTDFEWYNKLVDWVEEHIIAPICEALGIHSPSTESRDRVGKFVPAGIWEGIDGETPWLLQMIGNFGKKILGKLSEIGKKIKETVSSFYETVSDNVFGDPLEDLNNKLDAQAQDTYNHSQRSILGDREEEVKRYEEELDKVRSDLIAINSKLSNKNLNSNVRSALQQQLRKLTSTAKSYSKKIKEIYQDVGYTQLLDYNEDTGYIRTSASWYKAYYDIAKNIGAGFNLGIYDSIGGENLLADIIGTDVKTVREILDIHSPSRVMEKIGMLVGVGFNNGVSKEFDKTKDILDEFAYAIDSFNPDMSSPVITPVLDLSNIQDGMGYINSTLNSQQIKYLANMDIKSDSARNAERINDLTAAVDNLTIKSDQSDISGKLGSQSEILNRIADGLENQTIVLDSGALVGGISKKMDKSLGHNQYLRTRGAY